MRLAILGTRGIPNNYGGFEQFAEFVSVELTKRGHEVTVYNPASHPYKNNIFKNVHIVHISSPENIIGSAANFIYDYYCLKDAVKKNFDVIYEAGYATCSPFFHLLKKSPARLITNMDGLEWKRSKWNLLTKRLMKYLENLAVKKSHYIISDNLGIQQYYKKEFNRDSFFIAYGADIIETPCKEELAQFNVLAESYCMLIARMEPENNIDTILSAYKQSGAQHAFLVIGNYNTNYGQSLYKKYSSHKIIFLGSIYNKNVLDALRYYSLAYLHGHSVGGTNPSLLEAMASSAFIIAHRNPFNVSVLKNNALYFQAAEELSTIFSKLETEVYVHKQNFIQNNLNEIKINYSWKKIIDQYEKIFNHITMK